MWSRRSSCVVLMKSSVLARLSRNFFTESGPDIGVLVGSIGSGAVALCVRSCSIGINLSSLPAVADRFSGVNGVFITPSVIRPKINPSASAMWSAHSATDRRSGADLKFHCAAESPFVASRNAFFEPSSSAIALSRSAWVSVSVAGTATRNIATAKIMLFIEFPSDFLWLGLFGIVSCSLRNSYNPSHQYVARSPKISPALLLCVYIRLKHAEKVPLRIDAITKVAHARNRRLRHNQTPTGLRDRRDGRLQRLHAHRVRRTLYVAAPHDRAVDARSLFISRIHHPVVHRAIPLLDLPSEHLLVKRYCPVSVVHWNFKMNHSGHGTSPFSVFFLLRKPVCGLRLLCLHPCAVFLRCPSHNHPHQASGQNNFNVVAMLLKRHQQCENKSHKKPEQDSQRHGVYFAREDSC